ncbi:MAG: GNAT family N-acetyltransferase, partial [Tepidisphaeraceae bacterium]
MQLADAALCDVAAQWRLPLRLGLNFTPAALTLLGNEWSQAYARIETYPCGYLPLTMGSVEEYIGTLSKNARKDIRKKLRECGPVRIERLRDIEPYQDAINALYANSVDRAELAFGRQSQQFFRNITQYEPGAHYVLYWLGDELIAFNLLVRHQDRLIDKYFCMKPDAGRANSLYFVSWIENVRYCIEQAIPVYHAGPGAEMVKRRLGAHFIPSITLFRHRNPIVQMILKRLRSLFAYKSDNCRTDNNATAPEAPAAMGLAS